MKVSNKAPLVDVLHCHKAFECKAISEPESIGRPENRTGFDVYLAGCTEDRKTGGRLTKAGATNAAIKVWSKPEILPIVRSIMLRDCVFPWAYLVDILVDVVFGVMLRTDVSIIILEVNVFLS